MAELHCDVLFDGVEALTDVVVEIDGDRIRAVRPPSTTNPRVGGTWSATKTAFAMPGLIDAHAHCIGDGNLVRLIDPSQVDRPPESYEQVDALRQLCLLAGVTTVRDVGNHLQTVARARAQSPDHAHPSAAEGPRIAAAGELIGDKPLVWRFTRVAPDEASATAAVRELAEAGVDLITAYRGLDGRRLRAVLRAAAELDLPVAVDSVELAAKAVASSGVRSIEHATFLLGAGAGSAGRDPRTLLSAWADADPGAPGYQRLADRLAQQQTFVVPTLVLARRWALLDEAIGEPMIDWMLPVMPFHRHFKRMRHPWGYQIGKRYLARYLPYQEPSRELRRRIETGFRRVGELVCRLQASGVPIAVGTDTPNPSVVPGFGVHTELRHLVDVGMTPLAALTAATSAAANLIGRVDIGRITPGARADLVLFDANPLQNIDHLRHLRYVVLGGRLLDRDRIAERLRAASERVENGEQSTTVGAR